MTADEVARAERVESVLPALRDAAVDADRDGEFPIGHVKVLSDAGLMGLVAPVSHGGLGGGLRDLAGATFAMGTACPSTALAFFFHCSSASRGLLGLEAVAAGLFPDAAEAAAVRGFADRVLMAMGTEGRWMANFASEQAKSAGANITIATEATKVDGGWRINGVKSYGCATGVADDYLVTAKLAGTDTAEGLALFIVGRDADGVSERARWDAIGMRATATHGLVLEDVFVADDHALGVPGAFVRMMQMSRGTFVGNQLAATAVYAGCAQGVFDVSAQLLTDRKIDDTGESLGATGAYAWILGEMAADLDIAMNGLRRQLDLETSEPPLLPKGDVVKAWRIAKGTVSEAAFRVGTGALKACGTSSTGMSGPVSRALRDLSMGLVQAFPAEKGKLEAAQITVTGQAATGFAARK